VLKPKAVVGCKTWTNLIPRGAGKQHKNQKRSSPKPILAPLARPNKSYKKISWGVRKKKLFVLRFFF
jgi:hypothetical protein